MRCTLFSEDPCEASGDDAGATQDAERYMYQGSCLFSTLPTQVCVLKRMFRTRLVYVG